MAITKEQLEKVKLMQEKGNEWLANYKQYNLGTDPKVQKQHKQVTAMLAKAKQIIDKAEKSTVSQDEIGSIPTSKTALDKRSADKLIEQTKKSAIKEIKKEAKDLKKNLKGLDPAKIQETLEQWKDLATSWLDTGIDEILKAKGKLDKGFLGTAKDFISKAESFLKIASLFTGGELGDKVDKVKGWVESAKKAMDIINAADVYLKKWRDIAVGWMDSGISDIVSGAGVIGNITNNVVANAVDFKKLVKEFIDGAKALGNAELDEKVKKAQDWLKSADTILDKAGDMVDNLFKDADKNSLPDWYDVLSREWEKLAVKDLIPGKLDTKLLETLNGFKGKVDEWLKKATAEISPAIKDKIDSAKMWLGNIKKLIDLTEKGKEFTDAVRNKDFNAVYDKLKTMWNDIDSVGDIFAGTDIDNKLLDKIKELKAKADDFAKMANSLIKKLPFGDKLGDIDGWIKKAMEIATDMAKGEDVVGKYIELAKQWAEGEIKKVVDGTKEVTAEVAGQVSGFVNEVKKFMAGASSMKNGSLAEKIAAAGDWIKSSQSVLDKASEIIGMVTGDADGNHLPDWYDKLSKAWDNIGGKDLIPGMKIDDALIGKINVFKAEAEKWLAKAVGAGNSLKDKIANVRQWVEVAGGFLKEVAGFVEDIKEGDLLSIYEKIKKGWSAIGNTDDILRGTTVDNKVLDKAKEIKGQAEAWLANALTGGKADGKMTDEVKDILSLADNFLTFLFTKYEVEDHLQDFQEDKIVIKYPDGRQLTPQQVDDILGEFSGGMDGSLRNKLAAILTRINQEILNLGTEIDAAYRKTIAAGGGAANVYLLAQKDYESVMKKQKQVEKLLESLRKVLVGVITAALIPVNPAIAAAVGTLLSGTLGGFKDLAGLLASTASSQGGTVGQIGGLLSLVLPSGEGMSSMSSAEAAGLISLIQVFNNGVTAKYEEIKSLVAKIQQELDGVYKGLHKQTEAGIENAKDAIATSADKWKTLRAEITAKYVNTKETRINEKTAYWLLSRAQYASWLSTKKDTMIVDEVIEALTRFKIMQEAGVTWDTGVGGDIAKGLGWLFGGWASFGYDKKVKALREWAGKEIARLQTPAAWQGAF